MKKGIWWSVLFIGGLPGSATILRSAEPSRADTPADQKVLITRYCTGCHNQKSAAAGLALDRFDPAAAPHDPAVREKVIQKLRSGAMPPPGAPKPDKSSRDLLAFSLEAALDRAAAAHPNPGHAIAHRLNRVEYTNAVRDLLGVDVKGRDVLPADDAGYGFDNIADVLSLSPELLDRYMSAAGRISQMAVNDSTIHPTIQTYSVRREMLQHDRMSEDLPFGSRGGLSVHHYFPVTGEYLIKLRLQRTANNAIIGLAKPHQVDVRVDRRRIKTFEVGGAGTINPWAVVANPSLYEQTADDGLEVRLQLTAGAHQVGADFLPTSGEPEGLTELRLSTSSYEFAQDRDAEMNLGSIEIHGPFNPVTSDAPLNPRVFICAPRASTEVACAKEILSALARHAFRRPITGEDVDSLITFFNEGRAKGSFEAGIELALREILVDPEFLFRIEHDPPNSPHGSVHQVTDLELASRLSFFLWSSLPDEKLLQLATANELSEPAVLEGQIKRMLADKRSRALVNNFAGQWLYVRNIDDVVPDPDAFPEFDENLREAFRQETTLFIESQLREDHGVADLLTADYTFVNERLAQHYGIPGIYGNTFRRIKLTDSNRFGLLGQASILTVTSYAHRTSPTLRGKWIMQNLLGAPPPPPPPNVPALETGAAGKMLTVRQLMEEHRKNAVCASCHSRMDQYGFALENFDAIGRWRATDQAGTRIDATAVLPDGTKFEGVAGLRRLLLEDREQFAGALTERLMTYALGRGVEYYDRPAVRQVLRQAAAGGYRWSSLIVGIAESVPFRMRETP